MVFLNMVRCKCRALPMQCVHMWSNISAEPFWHNVLTHGQMLVLGLSDKMRSDVSAGHDFLIR